MTDAEFDAVRREAREHVKRTSFPAPAPEGDFEAHTRHAEYGENRH